MQFLKDVQKGDIIQKSGSWYSYNGERIGQGRENAKQFLKDNPHIREDVAEKIRIYHGIGEGVAPVIEKNDSHDADVLEEE